MNKLPLTEDGQYLDFTGIDPEAKRLLLPLVKQIKENKELQPADVLNLQLCLNSLDRYYKLKEQLGSQYTSLNRDGNPISNPILKELNALHKIVFGIIESYGGSIKSRKTLAKKDMQGDGTVESPMDSLLKADNVLEYR